jgi:hypothetical protein
MRERSKSVTARMASASLLLRLAQESCRFRELRGTDIDYKK